MAEYVDWFNQRRLHGEIGLVPPAQFEATYWAKHPVTDYVETPSPPGLVPHNRGSTKPGAIHPPRKPERSAVSQEPAGEATTETTPAPRHRKSTRHDTRRATRTNVAAHRAHTPAGAATTSPDETEPSEPADTPATSLSADHQNVDATEQSASAGTSAPGVSDDQGQDADHRGENADDQGNSIDDQQSENADDEAGSGDQQSEDGSNGTGSGDQGDGAGDQGENGQDD